MARVRVGINGFGRIGRVVFRALMSRKDEFDVVGINNVPFDLKGMAYLLKYDSTHGQFPGEVGIEGDKLVVNGKAIPVMGEKEPQKLPWKSLGAEIVMDSTGVFRKREELMRHIEAGARKVLLSAPAKGAIDATIVIGVNDDQLKREHQIISNASCTTNCLATMAKVLHEKYGIANALMTTVHALTNDQSLLDFIHRDLRRGRSAAYNIVPTSTGAATSVAEVYPPLKGRIDGTSLRVPVITGSITDLTCSFERPPASVDELNAALKAAAEGPYKGIIRYTDDEVVSRDIIGDPHSSIVDGTQTMRLEGKNLWKVFSWYDNEWGYSQRCADLIKKLAAL